MITNTILDVLFNRVKGREKTAKAVWDEVVNFYKLHTTMIVVILRGKLQTMVCCEGGDVRAHFTVMEDLHQQIAALGSDITDHDFASILQNALPSSYHHILGNVAAISTSSKEPPTTDTVLQFAFAKYDHRIIKSDSIEADALAVEAQGQPSWYAGAHGTWCGACGVGVGVHGRAC